MLKKGNENRAFWEAEKEFDVNMNGHELFRVFSVPTTSPDILCQYIEKIKNDSE